MIQGRENVRILHEPTDRASYRFPGAYFFQVIRDRGDRVNPDYARGGSARGGLRGCPSGFPRYDDSDPSAVRRRTDVSEIY